MPDDTVIISNLPSHSPSGSDYLAVENDSLTGKASVDDVVGASSSVATLNSNASTYLASGDFNSLTLANGATSRPPKLYYGNDLSQMSNVPNGYGGGANPWSVQLVPLGPNFYTKQILHVWQNPSNTNYITYIRYQTYQSGAIAWTPWNRVPTGPEVDTLNSKLTIEQIGSVITYTATATNTWVNVGSVSIPKSGLYYLTSSYNARCTALGFNSSTTITGAPDYGYQESSMHIYKTPMYWLPAGTMYIYGKFNATTVANTFRCYRYG